MQYKVFKTLELNKILERLAKYAITEGGKIKCLSLIPKTTVDEVNYNQTITSQATSLLLKDVGPVFSKILPIDDILNRAKIGSILSISDIINIRRLTENTKKLLGYYKSNNNFSNELGLIFNTLIPLPQLNSELKVVFDEGIYDDASDELYSIRKNIVKQKELLRSTLNDLISKYRDSLQDSVITMRNGRYCLPIKSEHKNKVRGMVHDSSATGSTFFIEPISIIEKNNLIASLLSSEEIEIQKILMQLSDKIAEHNEELLANYNTLTELDMIFAKGQLAINLNAHKPLLNTNNIISLREARHPLLNPKEVVPIDIYLDAGVSQFIITGPNTGGKTVTLKTVGLLTLMAQSGLHVPAKHGCEICIYEDIFADIGDEQSIEQSLSTFSSHMTNIIKIIHNSGNRSLALFDELGAGTDPVEGAALALAILSTLKNKGVTSFVTTHYSEIKVYASSTKGVINASCEFDIKSLRPTYRLRIGIAGKSNAFEISKRLGLPDTIIDLAKDKLKTSDIKLEDLLSELNEKKLSIENELKYSEKIRHEAELVLNKAKKTENDILEKKDKLLNKARNEASKILSDAKTIADEAISNINKLKHDTSYIKRLEENRQKLGKSLKDNLSTSRLSKSNEKGNVSKEKLKIGDRVHILSFKNDGTVLSLPDNKEKVYVQMGIMKIKVHYSDLKLLKEKPSITYNPSKINFSRKSSASMNISPEIKLLGYRGDEAIAELEKYIDDAVLSGLDSIRIVHGKGTGQLRAVIHKFLKTNPSVIEFALAEYGQGDAGVTIAKLK